MKNLLKRECQTTLLNVEIIRKKTFLKKIYIDFYLQFKSHVNHLKKKRVLVEIGSGGGFIKEIIPDILTSDMIRLKNLDMHFSGLKMPFEKESVDAFFMIDVFHHIPNAKLFLKEINRCLKKGGITVMIEPANTMWGRFIYKNFHHERFDPKGKWEFKSTSPLFSANGALPWIIFKRDYEKFFALFPNLKILEMKAHTPFRYLLSGGLSFPQLLPSFTYPLMLIFEKLISPLNPWLGMFYTIKIAKNKQ